MWLTGLSVVPVGFWAKQAVDRVVGCTAVLVHAPPNLSPLDGGWQLYAERQARAGGLVLGLRALEGETGSRVVRWLVVARMALPVQT